MNDTMKCVIFAGTGKYEIVDRPVPQIKRDGDVLVRTLAASICGSDVHYLATPPAMYATPGVILGHECVGDVVKTGSDASGFTVGDRVIMDNNISCGTCCMCQRGLTNLCENMRSMGSMIDGVFAEYFVADKCQLVKISPEIPVDTAVFAEPLNCVIAAVKRLHVVAGDSVLILGGGPIGLLFMMLLKAAGVSKAFVSEVSEYRASFARNVGADLVINPDKCDLKAKVLEATSGMGADIVIDAVGVLLPDAVACVRKGGQVLLFGLNSKKTQAVSQCDITMKGISVIGSYIGGFALSDVARILQSDMLDVESLITQRLPMERFGEGLNAMREGRGIKVVLYPFSYGRNRY